MIVNRDIFPTDNIIRKLGIETTFNTTNSRSAAKNPLAKVITFVNIFARVITFANIFTKVITFANQFCTSYIRGYDFFSYFEFIHHLLSLSINLCRISVFSTKFKKKKKNFKLYFNSLLYVAHILGLQELNEIYIMRTMGSTYEVRKIFLKR